MSEVSTVGALIRQLIAIAIGLGAAGTLVDNTILAKSQAQKAVTQQGISYLKWNEKLVRRNSK